MRYFFIEELDELIAIDSIHAPASGVEISKEEYELFLNPPRGAIRKKSRLEFEVQYFFVPTTNSFVCDIYVPNGGQTITKEEYKHYSTSKDGMVRVEGEMRFVEVN